MVGKTGIAKLVEHCLLMAYGAKMLSNRKKYIAIISAKTIALSRYNCQELNSALICGYSTGNMLAFSSLHIDFSKLSKYPPGFMSNYAKMQSNRKKYF
jgi:hypothetical protein